jgi:hypothetical protein
MLHKPSNTQFLRAFYRLAALSVPSSHLHRQHWFSEHLPNGVTSGVIENKLPLVVPISLPWHQFKKSVSPTAKTLATTASIVNFVITSVSELYLFVLKRMLVQLKNWWWLLWKKNLCKPIASLSEQIFDRKFVKYWFLELMSRKRNWHYERQFILDDSWRDPVRQMYWL